MDFDQMIANVATKVSADDVSRAAEVYENLEEDRLSFGAVNMFALDKK